MLFSVPTKPQFQEVWVWGNDKYPQWNIRPSFLEVKIRFISNGTEYSAISAYSDRRVVDIYYDTNSVYLFEGGEGSFKNENYATMIFLEPPIQPLLGALNEYATKIQ